MVERALGFRVRQTWNPIHLLILGLGLVALYLSEFQVSSSVKWGRLNQSSGWCMQSCRQSTYMTVTGRHKGILLVGEVGQFPMFEGVKVSARSLKTLS